MRFSALVLLTGFFILVSLGNPSASSIPGKLGSLVEQDSLASLLSFDPLGSRAKDNKFARKEDGTFSLKINSSSVTFPQTLNSGTPIIVETRQGKVLQYLVGEGSYKAELGGRYLIYKGEKKSILYTFDTNKNELREYVYLPEKGSLDAEGSAVRWRFSGGTLKARGDGSVAVIKKADPVNKVRQVSNNDMAARISKFFAKHYKGKLAKEKTLFVIPKPMYVNAKGEEIKTGIRYQVDISKPAINPHGEKKQSSIRSLDGEGDTLALILEDEPVFPVWADPSITFPAADAEIILNGTNVDDRLGTSVASAGDFNGDGINDVIVGAPGSVSGGGTFPGSAYIFFGQNPASPLSLTAGTDADVILNGTGAIDQFGVSVSSAGDFNNDGFSDVIVGAYRDDNTGADSGSAFIFFGRSPASQLILNADADADLILNGTNAGSRFGHSVSSAGDFNNDGRGDVIVGADEDGVIGVKPGKAYVFFGRDDAVLPVQVVLDANTGADVVLNGTSHDDKFGWSVSSAGDFNNDGFDEVIVGARLDDNNATNNSGSAFIFFGQNPVSQLVLTADPDANVILNGSNTGDQFGRSVSSAGDFNNDGVGDVIVGAHLDDNNGANDSGSAFIFFGQSPVSQLTLTADTGADVILDGTGANDRFGGSVSSAGDFNGDGINDVIVGASLDDNNGNASGSAFVFYGSATPASPLIADTDANIILNGQDASDFFGNSVASAGDFNGDGLDELIVGAVLDDNNGSSSGSAFIFEKFFLTANTDADVVLNGQDAGDEFGFSVSSAGDFNGDGIKDVIVSAVEDDNSASNSGSAFIFFGSTTPASPMTADADADVILNGANFNSSFGSAVSSAGDFNGDGFGDVIVGDPTIPGPVANEEGAAYIFFGSAAPTSPLNAATDADITFWGDEVPIPLQLSIKFGHAVSSAGDFNGDGFGDVIVGAPWDHERGNSSGSAFIFFGSATPASPLNAETGADVILRGQSGEGLLGYLGDQFGVSVSSAGDFNGDGFGDVIVGARGDNNNGNDSGSAFIFFGSATPVSPLVADAGADVILNGQTGGAFVPLPGDFFGSSVSFAGDFNGDGFGDVIVGAPGDDNNGNDSGSAFVFFGSATPASPLNADAGADVILNGQNAEDTFGGSVSLAGDFNNDGLSDVMVGLKESNLTVSPFFASVYVFFGQNPMSQLTLNSSTDADVIIESTTADDNFGSSLATAGDFNGDGVTDLIIGASGRTFGSPIVDTGNAYMFFGEMPVSSPASQVRNDFDGDGDSDLLLVHDNGTVVGVLIENSAYQSHGLLAQLDPAQGWTVNATGDMNGDGRADLLLYNTSTGEYRTVLLNGTTVISDIVAFTLDPLIGIEPRGLGDFDGDGDSEIILYQPASGLSALVHLAGGAFSSFELAAQVDVANNWTLSNCGDFNQDGKTDLVTYNTGTGEIAIIQMDGATPSTPVNVFTLSQAAGYTLEDTGDFNGDGKTDLLAIQASTGALIPLLMDGLVYQSAFVPGNMPFGFELVNAGIYDGDNISDFLVYSDTSGEIVTFIQDGTTVTTVTTIFNLGPASGWTYHRGKPRERENTLYGLVDAIEFTPTTLVSQLLIDIDNNWLGDPTWFLDVEITGLNGGFAHHGNDRLAVIDGTVFFSGPAYSDVVFDWTTDSKPRTVNEVYTVCTQVVHVLNGVDIPVGGVKCSGFGPF